MVCNVGPIRKIHARLIEDGYHVSDYALRLWIKQGRIPAIYTGNKALISYESVLSLLMPPPTPEKDS